DRTDPLAQVVGEVGQLHHAETARLTHAPRRYSRRHAYVALGRQPHSHNCAGGTNSTGSINGLHRSEGDHRHRRRIDLSPCRYSRSTTAMMSALLAAWRVGRGGARRGLAPLFGVLAHRFAP
ncbi:MAG: hypothetical protein M3R63_13920, partial [Actinomycetota bacterium]|nr:hypothetical protein [Actinomycetota bacterium]